MDEPPVDSTEKFEQALEAAKSAKHVLRLYIAGNTRRSAQAIAKIHEICETLLNGRYELEVIDIYQQPELARGGQIVAAPTLIKLLPQPLRRLIGDLTQTKRILVGLDLIQLEDDSHPADMEHPADAAHPADAGDQPTEGDANG